MGILLDKLPDDMPEDEAAQRFAQNRQWFMLGVSLSCSLLAGLLFAIVQQGLTLIFRLVVLTASIPFGLGLFWLAKRLVHESKALDTIRLIRQKGRPVEVLTRTGLWLLPALIFGVAFVALYLIAQAQAR